MKATRTLRLPPLFFILLLATPVFGADVEVGIRHIVSHPMGESGDLDIAPSRGFAATAEVFWTERISTQFAAAFVNPEAMLGDVDLGTLGLDTYSLTARYHFKPASHFSAYAGGGVALVSIGNLDDQFGDAIELEFGNETTFVIAGGVRYRLTPRLFMDVELSYMPLRATGEGRGMVPEVTLDPATLSAGVSWRF